MILCREILVSGLREYLAELKVGVPVSKVAKWKTTVQLCRLGFLIAGPAGETVLPGTQAIGLRCCGLAAIAHALDRLGLHEGGDQARHRRPALTGGVRGDGIQASDRVRWCDEARLFRLGPRADRQAPRRSWRLPPERRHRRRPVGWLRARGEEYAYAFENPGVIRAAIDRTHAKHDAAIAGAREIAFFPPMTGG